MKLSMGLRTALAAYFGSLGTCQLYSGTIPANGNATPTGTLLAEFNPAASSGITWGSAVSGTESVVPNVTPATVDTTGTVGYARFFSGSDQVFCTVGTSSAEVILDRLVLAAGQTVRIVSATLTVPG